MKNQSDMNLQFQISSQIALCIDVYLTWHSFHWIVENISRQYPVLYWSSFLLIESSLFPKVSSSEIYKSCELFQHKQKYLCKVYIEHVNVLRLTCNPMSLIEHVSSTLSRWRNEILFFAAKHSAHSIILFSCLRWWRGMLIFWTLSQQTLYPGADV